MLNAVLQYPRRIKCAGQEQNVKCMKLPPVDIASLHQLMMSLLTATQHTTPLTHFLFVYHTVLCNWMDRFIIGELFTLITSDYPGEHT